jgi:hypothetical protein
MARPASTEYAPFYAGYVGLVTEEDVLPALVAQRDEVMRLAAAVPKDRETYRYADGKWTIRGIFGHIGDGERVFGYRAFCIARGDQAAFPGFDQEEYMAVEDYATVPVAELAAEFAALRAVGAGRHRERQRGDRARARLRHGRTCPASHRCPEGPLRRPRPLNLPPRPSLQSRRTIERSGRWT